MIRKLGLYYLNARYYDSNWGRFLNADGLVSTGQGLLSHNMYLYCNNNPVNNYDPTGCLVKPLTTREELNAKARTPIPVVNNPSNNIVTNTVLTPRPSTPTKSEGTVVATIKNVSFVQMGPGGELPKTPTGNIVVVDLRKYNNPSMVINNSYKITSAWTQYSIASTMIKYNNQYPVENPVEVWDRNINTIVLEWQLHNEAYCTLNAIGWHSMAEHGKDAGIDNHWIYSASKTLLGF